MYYVYLLLCEDNSYYIGSTNNVAKRFQDHLAGHGARYTKSHKPKRVVYQEEFPTKSLALRREAELKKLTRTQKEKLVGQPHLPVV